VLQAQNGLFIGTAEAYDGSASHLDMVAFDAAGNTRWSVRGYGPRIATADGGVIAQAWDPDAQDFTGTAVTFDENGNATGMMATLTQSWRGNEYTADGAVSSLSSPPVFPDGASFWSQAGGNPSENGTAFVQCPCLLQSAGTGQINQSAHPTAASQSTFQPVGSGLPLKTYVILEGDPGLNLGTGHNHNVGNLFHLAAGTAVDALNAQGNLAGLPQRVSSVQDFARQLTTNGPITGGVIYFGHGVGMPFSDQTWSSALAPGEQAGRDTNVSLMNVNLLSNTQLDPAAIITLRACYAGFGSGRYSIAQLISNQLQRRVYAPLAGMYFGVDPNSTYTGTTAPKNLPDQKPMYMIQEFGRPLTCSCPEYRVISSHG
jgi:hypothetical protein